MVSSFYYRVIVANKAIIRIVAAAAIIVPVIGGSGSIAPNNLGQSGPREGYDARTGKWINKKPSVDAFPITPQTYQKIKNWYATDSGTNNPQQLEVEPPKEGYTYIYTPYNDPKHPESVGMSSQGQEGYKGYWYADDLSKATDSVTSKGEDIPIPPPKDNSPEIVKFGGYDARTGNWVNTTPSDDAFHVSYKTYNRVKNWFATNYGADNPLNLPIEMPKENYTYLYIPFNDPKHPGVVGMSFEGDNSYKGSWYADKIGVTNDTISIKPANQNVQPLPSSNANQAVQPPSQAGDVK